MQTKNFPLIFERSKTGRTAYALSETDIPTFDIGERIGKEFVREEPADLPEVSELELIRHYTALSNRNLGIDSGFYPLGSWTMKYNPKINEDIAMLDGYTNIYPLQNPDTVQGALQVIYDLKESLKEITGMAEVSLQTATGAQGECTALLMIRVIHEANGDWKRTNVISPD